MFFLLATFITYFKIYLYFIKAWVLHLVFLPPKKHIFFDQICQKKELFSLNLLSLPCDKFNEIKTNATLFSLVSTSKVHKGTEVYPQFTNLQSLKISKITHAFLGPAIYSLFSVMFGFLDCLVSLGVQCLEYSIEPPYLRSSHLPRSCHRVVLGLYLGLLVQSKVLVTPFPHPQKSVFSLNQKNALFKLFSDIIPLSFNQPGSGKKYFQCTFRNRIEEKNFLKCLKILLSSHENHFKNHRVTSLSKKQGGNREISYSLR